MSERCAPRKCAVTGCDRPGAIRVTLAPEAYMFLCGACHEEWKHPDVVVTDLPSPRHSWDDWRKPALFQHGDFTLHSGEETFWKIDCDALGPDEWRTLARIAVASMHMPPFGMVEGVPRGGLAFARALDTYATTGPLLIADDVYTTGASMEAHRAGREAIGIVVFARRPVTQPWIRALFTYTMGEY